MSANGQALQGSSEIADTGKGKGKAVEQPDLMMEEDDESDEESAHEEVRA